ncbi:MAG TPA: polysaccharide deacetylase family protein [Gaiellaceae bacterium]|nr:polysaccharide deacetylase family protein [Gaiellaceae bacterium]
MKRWLLLLVLALAACGSSGRITVRVDGLPMTVAKGTTLASLHLHAPRGNLLAVDGSVLRSGAYPGRVVGPATLHDGDRIRLVRGESRREPLETLRQKVLPSPQFFLARTRGTQVVVRGFISHKLVSARLLPFHALPDRAVALTFDDGPGPYTLEILRELQKLHVKATFFDIGFEVDMYPGLVDDELKAGMTVGNHTYNHPEVPPFEQLPARLLADEVSLGAASLRNAGAKPMLFRPPAGSSSAKVVAAANTVGERVILWSVDPRDWEAGATAAGIVRAVLSAVRPGSIVDLHDGGGDRSATLRALPAIVKGIHKRHLRLVAIPTG